ncbi:sserine/threonine protein kinase with PASTA sensor domain [Nitzschia inconspicua]|uniref:Sserine/threonine protein kinase with PASTA sensor domain n=1 Tax=Nitzschia inconspicua TaxID=303405 RepID=A0A9K3PF27_9STRA|nr:sserine/threonine protein kinase with PASTA sensor domain [Nitzschia inconspicua]
MRSSIYGNRQRLLSATSVGNRSPTLTHLKVRDIGGYQMDLVVREVSKRLYDDSTFFSENRTQELPSFDVDEVHLGPTELGRGEFGVVYQVDALSPTSCECPKCLLKRLYDTPEDRHKLAASELNVLEEHEEEDNGKGLQEKSTESSTIQTSQSTAPHNNANRNKCDNKYVGTTQQPQPESQMNKKETDSDEIVEWTDDVEKSLNKIFSDEFQMEEQRTEMEDDDNVSGLSEEDNSVIRPNGNIGGEPLHTKSLRENFDTYRKCFMQRNCLRQGRPRYAVKRLRSDIEDEETKYNAAIDLAVEAKYLAVLKHPNIVRVRATAGRPGHDNFMIMMDCLNLTLREKIVEWDYDTKILRNATSNVVKRILRIGNQNYSQPDDSSKMNPAMMDLHTEKLMAAYDLVRGMKFLHSNRVLYRDLKPENIAFDVRGRLKIFDLGLAKELKPKDLQEPPDGYKATGLTGSRRYMAPEVVLCKNYGFAADVYSYSIVIWEVFSGKLAYEEMDFNSHFEEVVMKEKRPSTKLYGIPKTLITLMQNAWDPDPLRRVDFKYVRQILKHECKLLNHDHIENGHRHHLSNRTDYLMRQSARSQTKNESA